MFVLARTAPDKLAEVQAGVKSTHRACVEAGIVKVPTVLDQVKRLLPRLTAEELAEVRGDDEEGVYQTDECR